MNFTQLKQQALERHPELLLEEIISHRLRKKIKVTFLILAVLLLAGYLLVTTTSSNIGVVTDNRLLGMACLMIAGWLVFLALDAFYYSHYYAGALGDKNGTIISYELARVVVNTPEDDITLGLLRTDFGRHLGWRLGLPQAAEEFSSQRKKPLTAADFVPAREGMNLLDHLSELYRQDSEWSKWLTANEVKEEDLLGAARWQLRALKTARMNERWWSRTALRRLGSVGRDWSYGRAYELEKYAHFLDMVSGSGGGDFYHQKELEQLINILTREREPHAILVGPEGSGKTDVVYELAGRINADETEPGLRDKRVAILRTDILIPQMENKTALENELQLILQQSAWAGNLILVLPDLPEAAASAAYLGCDLPALLSNYLPSSRFSVIAFSDPDGFHNNLENNREITNHLEKIQVSEGGKRGIMNLLENQALAWEKTHPVVISYPALVAVAEAAERYFTDSGLRDKAFDLLSEAVSAAENAGRTLITSEEVNSLVEAKTGIVTGRVSSKEREKLQNLEEIMHRRVVGQDEAIRAVSRAVRSARAGINVGNRPLGSFLFLGPTGVGKTETAKALAEVFFDDRDRIMRLDMSEFNSSSAMAQLLGSFEEGKPGVLANMVRDNPYGVLLLDEFEKAHSEVPDLFLQILDEGVFSDAGGHRVNARNIIFIATSNAQSNKIWEVVERGEDPNQHRDEMINALIDSGELKPELINRFDGVIMFHPLQEQQVRAIAEKKLQDLKQRVKNKGIELKINQALVDYVATKGRDEKFGARPINRVISEDIESRIAEEMISGQAKAGSEIEFTQEQLQAGD